MRGRKLPAKMKRPSVSEPRGHVSYAPPRHERLVMPTVMNVHHRVIDNPSTVSRITPGQELGNQRRRKDKRNAWMVE